MHEKHKVRANSNIGIKNVVKQQLRNYTTSHCLVRIIISCIVLIASAWVVLWDYHDAVLQYGAAAGSDYKYDKKSIISAPISAKSLSLRLDWNNLEPHSELARRMMAHQRDCSKPMGNFVFRNTAGLGSDLHLWGQALCNGMQLGMRVRTAGNWTFMDEHQCGITRSHNNKQPSPMLCYFQSSELNCPGDVEEAMAHPEYDPKGSLTRPDGWLKDICQPIYRGMERPQVRMSAMELLFLHVDPKVIQEARRQLNLVFHGLNEVPKDLITVHIRWGDKKVEMELVQIQEYIGAIRQILEQRRRRRASGGRTSDAETANIYLATEDPEAVRQFRESMPKEWNLYVEHAYSELLPHRVDEYSGNTKMSIALHGRVGLISLGSLLVAMEANDFVLTTRSNWSRVMNELRKGILDPRCGNCTSMIDLRIAKKEW